MKINKKIGLIAMPIGILIVMFFVSLQFQHDVSLQPKNELGGKFMDINDVSSLNLPIVGFSDAPVTIIAFNDYQCKDCKTWYDKEYTEISKKLIETKKANMVFLDAISLGDDSVLISEATYCAEEQGKYSEYQEILFRSQQEIDDWAKYEQLKKFATDIKLEPELFESCLDSGKYEKQVLSNISYAKIFGVDKIPVFKIVNFEGKEYVLKGGIPNDVFENIVNQFQ
jgi:protein-disulfide isomerase